MWIFSGGSLVAGGRSVLIDLRAAQQGSASCKGVRDHFPFPDPRADGGQLGKQGLPYPAVVA